MWIVYRVGYLRPHTRTYMDGYRSPHTRVRTRHRIGLTSPHTQSRLGIGLVTEATRVRLWVYAYWVIFGHNLLFSEHPTGYLVLVVFIVSAALLCWLVTQALILVCGLGIGLVTQVNTLVDIRGKCCDSLSFSSQRTCQDLQTMDRCTLNVLSHTALTSSLHKLVRHHAKTHLILHKQRQFVFLSCVEYYY